MPNGRQNYLQITPVIFKNIYVHDNAYTYMHVKMIRKEKGG